MDEDDGKITHILGGRHEEDEDQSLPEPTRLCDTLNTGPRTQKRTSAQRRDCATCSENRERDQPSQRRGEKRNQPPRNHLEDDLLEDDEELLLYHEVGCLGEERRKCGAQVSRGS